MFSRKRELPIWVVAAAAVSVPLATLGWSAVASAQPGSIPVTITVTPSANPSSFGQDVTYTATLVTSDSGSLVIPDSIEFQDSGNDIDGCSSQPLSGTSTVGTYTATCDESASQLSVGVHSITAFFGGDSTYNSGSGSLNQSVGKGTTTTSITSPASGASVPYGNEGQNSLNVLVSAAAGANLSPSNSVNFYAGAPGPETLLCTAFLNGMGSGKSDGSCNLNYNQLEAGHYSLTAVYGGDNTFLASSSTPQAFNVTQITTRMNVFPVPGYAFYGAESGNFFIVGAGGGGGGNPTGFFTITAGGISLIAPNSCSASNGGGNPCFIDSATALPASTTPYAVTVSYPGDSNFTPASTTVPLLVFPATTSTQLTVSPSSATYGKEGTVTISASVISGTTGAPTGPVDVQSGGSTVSAISDLRATGRNAAAGSCRALGNVRLPSGDYALTANYQGDGNFQSSVSSAQTLDIASQGYWLVGSNGAVFPFGTSQSFGSMAAASLNGPIVGIASTPDGGGYWEVARDGGIFAFGDAKFFGSMGGYDLNQPIVGIAATADGGGYWEVARDGGVFAFGDARFHGSMGGSPLNRPVVGIAADPTTGGYWLVASDGGIFSFSSPFHGSTGGLHLNAPVVAMASTSDGGGYWEVSSDGGVFAQGNAPFLGSMGGKRLNQPIVAMAEALSGVGYRLVGSDGGIFAFGDAEFDGSTGGQPLNSPSLAWPVRLARGPSDPHPTGELARAGCRFSRAWAPASLRSSPCW